jgi:hypothetical protein
MKSLKAKLKPLAQPPSKNENKEKNGEKAIFRDLISHKFMPGRSSLRTTTAYALAYLFLGVVVKFGNLNESN